MPGGIYRCLAVKNGYGQLFAAGSGMYICIGVFRGNYMEKIGGKRTFVVPFDAGWYEGYSCKESVPHRAAGMGGSFWLTDAAGFDRDQNRNGNGA